MARRVDSAALDSIALSLNLSGPAAGETWFEDGNLQQVLDVASLIRRGRTVAASEGIFNAVLRNVHTSAQTRTTAVTPYDVATGAIEPWPTPVPSSLDIWVIQASVRQISGSGTLGAALFANYDARTQAFGVDDSGSALVASNHQPIISWDALETFGGFSMGVKDSTNTSVPMMRPFRLLRGFNPGTELTFSSTSSAVATFDCQLLLGLFPIGMGQDVSF